ncbi:NTP transferase domain-containing protein, partial [Candidatus Gottesmanbacteria bacterium]|nr:NTP transferase domain-containing protein [Candidatus Gottesmanbacteria bacterium]
MKDIHVLILAGGDSTRFWPLGDKLFLNFLGKPILFYRLKQLQKYGFRNITVVCSEVNENNFLIFKHAYPEFQFELVKQVDKRGMAGAVLSAEHLIDSKSVLIIKPIDLFEDILFEEFKRLLEKNKPEHILTGVTTNTYFPGGYLAIENERLLNIVEKPHPGQEPSNIVRIVFDYFQDISIFLKFLKESKTTKDELY